MIDDFKAFTVKGNALDLAVGVIIGATFGKIVKSIVDDIFNSIIGMLIGGVDLSNIKITLKKAVEADAANNPAASPEVAVKIGTFLNMCIEFKIVAWAVFLLVKAINRLAERTGVPLNQAPKARRSTNRETAARDRVVSPAVPCRARCGTPPGSLARLLWIPRTASA
ncbi:MAG: large conductance mechanosensitive channel protein MscL [Planctomycetes bacterium]|nr:large conductance mechanosensitive channel protein MscL [Planctomycetota bacterium]